MQQPASTTSSSGSASFAGLMAALATPAPKRATAWNDDDLADDVATLSYERALRTHTRFKSPDTFDRALNQTHKVESVRIFEALPGEPETLPLNAEPQPTTVATVDEAATENFAAPDRNRKNASITIRLSRTECAQLRKRAAEAGLTISAYMRSCTFETESLRALVKDTLAQMRTEPSDLNQPVGNKSAGSEGRRSWHHWFGHLWPHTRGGDGPAQA